MFCCILYFIHPSLCCIRIDIHCHYGTKRGNKILKKKKKKKKKKTWQIKRLILENFIAINSYLHVFIATFSYSYDNIVVILISIVANPSDFINEVQWRVIKLHHKTQVQFTFTLPDIINCNYISYSSKDTDSNHKLIWVMLDFMKII